MQIDFFRSSSKPVQSLQILLKVFKFFFEPDSLPSACRIKWRTEKFALKLKKKHNINSNLHAIFGAFERSTGHARHFARAQRACLTKMGAEDLTHAVQKMQSGF